MRLVERSLPDRAQRSGFLGMESPAVRIPGLRVGARAVESVRDVAGFALASWRACALVFRVVGVPRVRALGVRVAVIATAPDMRSAYSSLTAERGRKWMFDPDKLYLTDDPALLVLGRPLTLAHWRCEGRGPAYIKMNGRVAYRGSDLNEWLEARTVRPTDDSRGGVSRDFGARSGSAQSAGS